MVLCGHAIARTDIHGRIQYVCTKLAWQMDLDGLSQCKSCSHYMREKVAGSK